MEKGGIAGVTPVKPIEQFPVDIVTTVSGIFGSTPHLGRRPVLVLSNREMAKQTGPNTGAAYSAENGGMLLWREESRIAFEQFFSGRYRALPERKQVEFLRGLKIELLLLVHEATHAQGPGDQEQFEHDYVNGILDDGIRAFKEGITQVAAEAILDDVIRAMRLDRIDPRLLEIKTPDAGVYPGQTLAMRMVMDGVAQDCGRSSRDELVDVVRDGSGNLALDRMVRRYVRAQGGRPGVTVLAAVQQVVRQALAETAAEFADVLQTGRQYGVYEMQQLDGRARFIAAQRGAAIRNGLREVTAQVVAMQQTEAERFVAAPRPARTGRGGLSLAA